MKFTLNPRDPRLVEFLTGLSFHPETLDTLAEREFQRVQAIAASGMKGCRKAQKLVKAATNNGLRGAK